ncbi:unnamed protein product [Ceutorhynchus assimilis]|uniref:Lipase domain-containing protein n=1 Tax=Ceutorhynchus assimilis TaxID=467358 RepID=A0A9N9QI03_9CUCU|nr:unnamed protein product [Ceutorhynchus assimilis]
MKIIVVLAAIFAVSLAKSVNLLRTSQITDELINDPRFLIYEVEEGLFEVDDLETSVANITTKSLNEDVTFYIFTPENPDRGVQVRASQLHDIVRKTGFNIRRQTLVVIHGWRNDYTAPVNDRIKNAALRNHNINVIVVDWSPIASRNYVTAKGSVLAVGNYVGDFLLRLDDELDHRLHKMTIVGHSLGAHVSGNVGARTKGLITTIIGLDPAGPLFSAKNINNRLDPTDAEYVHVIHTNDKRLGWGIKMGHADYFPNGGKSQPGCGLDISGSCAHARAYKFFAESLDNDNFSSKLCGSYSNFQKKRCGENVPSNMGGFPIVRTSTGNYYLYTNKGSPFARG